MPEVQTDDPILGKSYSTAILISSFLLMLSLTWALYDEFFGLRPWRSYQLRFADAYSRYLKRGIPKQAAALKAINVKELMEATLRMTFAVAPNKKIKLGETWKLEQSVPAGPLAVTTSTLTTSGLPDAIVTASSGSNNFVTVLLDPSSFATGSGSLQTPYPASEYVDLGVKVKATPSVHDDHEVTLQLEFEIRALSGNSVNGIPIITNRTVSQTVRLKENEPSVIAGLLDREETKSLSGIPGLANLPVAGYAFGTRSTSSNETELLIIVTPRRMNERIRASRPKYAGRGGATATGAPPPAPSEP